MAAAQIHGWHQVKSHLHCTVLPLASPRAWGALRPWCQAIAASAMCESSGAAQGILEHGHGRPGAAPEFLVRDGKFSITLGRILLFLRPTGCLGRSARLLSE